MMITQHDNNGELSCFKSALLFYLRESHPHMADDKAFIRERADSAAEAYEHAIRDGLSVRQALEQADAVLYQDLRFFPVRYGFRGRIGVVSRSTARKTDGFLPEGIVARRGGIRQIFHRRQV